MTHGKCGGRRALAPALAPLLVGSALLISSCSTQRPYERPTLGAAASWANAPSEHASDTDSLAGAVTVNWWQDLQDPAINSLVSAALAENPTLTRAAAAVEEARATVRVAAARQVPGVDLNGAANRARVFDPIAAGSRRYTFDERSEVVGPSFSWELDLWGRLRESRSAAVDRLGARSADADAARLSLVAQIANDAVSLRACGYSLAVREEDITSREVELRLTQQRLQAGNLAPVEEAAAATDLENARTDHISQQQQCIELVDILVALTGQPARTVRE